MLRFLFLKVAVIAVAQPVISLCPPIWGGGSSAVLTSAVAQPVPAQTSTVFDAVGDTIFPNDPAFQDIVFARMTKTAGGDFALLVEVTGPVPVAPPLPAPGVNEIWWGWAFDLDPTALPIGYPWGPGDKRRPEFIVYVSWDGTAFAGTAVDRRPLLTGGEAIITPVPFSINGTIVKAVLAYELIGDVPPSFHWSPMTVDRAGPVGSASHFLIDHSETVFNP